MKHTGASLLVCYILNTVMSKLYKGLWFFFAFVFHGMFFVSEVLSLLFFLQIKLQESPEDMPAGQTPHTVVLFAHNDLVDKVQPGDRVNVTGKNLGL